MLQAALQSGELPVTTKSNLVMVTGPANRLLLTKGILEFCGALPIYNTELSPSNSAGNGTESKLTNQKGPSQPHLCFCLDARVCLFTLFYFNLFYLIISWMHAAIMGLCPILMKIHVFFFSYLSGETLNVPKSVLSHLEVLQDNLRK